MSARWIDGFCPAPSMRKVSPVRCTNCGGYPPGPWLAQWRAEHPRSQRTSCRMKLRCLFPGFTVTELEALWHGNVDTLLSAKLPTKEKS